MIQIHTYNRMTAAVFVLAFVGALGTTSTTGDASVTLVKNRDLDRVGNHSVEADESLSPTSKYQFLFIVGKDRMLSVGVSEDVVGLRPFYLHMYDASNNEKIHLQHSFSGQLSIRQKMAIVHRIQKVDALPETLRVEVHFVEVVETTFFHTVINPWTVKPGTYQLAPEHRGMGVRFTLNFTESTAYWKVQRRPPIPDFVARVTDGNGQLVTEGVASDVPPSGVTFDNVFDLTRQPQDDFNWTTCTLSVTFLEPLAEFHGRAVLEHAKSELTASLSRSGDTFVIPLNDKGGLKLRLEAKGSDVSIIVLQPFPIEDLTVLMRLNQELLFAESESHVPYVEPSSSRTQFGWMRVFNTNYTSMASSDSLEFVVTYNREEHEGLREKEKELLYLQRFVRRYGGSVEKIKPVVYSRGPTTFAANTLIESGEVVFTVPYQTVLQHDICDKVAVLETFFSSVAFESFVRSSPRIDPELLRSVMSITLCSVVMPNSPVDGTNWRTMFRSYMHGPPSLPMFWDKDVLATLFAWSPVMEEVRLQIAQWTDEYDTWIEAMEGTVSRNITLQEYFVARGHVLGKLLNISGLLSLAPIHSVLQHDDEPNVLLQLDDARKLMIFTAARRIPKGTPLVTNKGSTEKLQAEFLVHHGVVPLASISSAVVRNVTLTPEKRSRRPLLEALDNSNDVRALQALEEAINKALEALPTNIPEVKGEEQKRAMALRLLEGERRVLRLHLQYLQEDIAQLSVQVEGEL